MEIVSTESANEVDSFVANFHTQEFFETAYARNSVKHILSGKAHDCAVHTQSPINSTPTKNL